MSSDENDRIKINPADARDGFNSREHRDDITRQAADESLSSAELEELRSLFQDWQQEALPTMPEIPGWHLCWLSTTNQYDPIQKRMRLGFVPAKPEDFGDNGYSIDFDSMRLKSGKWEGYIGVNEMLLFKLPMRIYQAYMLEAHHDAPRREEQRLKELANADLIKDGRGKPLLRIEGDGLDQLAGNVRRPTHFEG